MRHKLYLLLFIPILLMDSPTIAQSTEIFHGARYGDSPDRILKMISAHSGEVHMIEPQLVSFPLANRTETHLLAEDLKIDGGTLDKVAFSFADNELVMVQAIGNFVGKLAARRKDSAMVFNGYEVYREDGVFFRKDKDMVWFMDKAGLHPNLFTWENPYLDHPYSFRPRYNDSAEIPECIEMGGELEVLRVRLEKASTFMYEEELDGSDPNAQLQLNAFGIEYAGFPRKIEARFGDGKLNVVWILTAKAEEDRIRQKLTAAFGPAIEVMEDWEVFANWTVLLRKDKPEVLLLTEDLGQFYKKDYFKK